MARIVFCVWAAIVAGFGGAVVLGLGTAAVTAAAYKSEVRIEDSVAKRVQATRPAILAAAGIGFVAGAGVIVWLFASTWPKRGGPAEPGPSDRSEV